MFQPFSLSPDEIATRAVALYRERLQAVLDVSANSGKFVSIDINTGDHVLGDRHIETSRLLRQRQPNAIIYTLRIGFPAAVSMSGRLQPDGSQ